MQSLTVREIAQQSEIRALLNLTTKDDARPTSFSFFILFSLFFFFLLAFLSRFFSLLLSFFFVFFRFYWSVIISEKKGAKEADSSHGEMLKFRLDLVPRGRSNK